MTQSIIIGGGIIGMLTAWNLHRSGHDVSIIEKSETGRESSWAGGGIISPLYPWRYHNAITRLARYGQQHYAQICEDLCKLSGVDPQYTKSGLLIIAPDEEAAATRWAADFHPSLEINAAEQITAIEPAMQPSQKSAVWMPEIAQVRNPRIARALSELMLKLGITVIKNTPVTAFETGNGQITAVVSEKQRFTADNYVVCSGAWTGDLLRSTGIDLPVMPVKGQMILFKAAPGDIKRIVLEEDRYIIPRQDGRVLFGSTVEHTGYTKQISESARKELHDIAVERFPVLKDKPVEHHWAGLRPGSPDGIPVIGRHPTLENLFVNAGHFRNGVVLAPGSCHLVSQIINGNKDELDNPVFSPANFS